jgi:CRP/FNR family transcriptional regulator, cyclic AMP receptor protein
MTPYSTSSEPQKPLEDALAYLPCSSVLEHRKGQFIYHQHQRGANLYLIIEGRVKVSLLANDGDQAVVDIYKQDEFFGEAALLQNSHGGEQATAMDDTKLMRWSAAELQDIIERRPQLAMAFMQILVQRTMDFANRIESFCGDTVDRRLARALIRFSERMGTETGAGDGSFRMPPLTHELLAQYVGTSRENVSTYMNQFRRDGYIKFSRKEMILFRDPLCEWVRADFGLHSHRAKSSPAKGSLAQ